MSDTLSALTSKSDDSVSKMIPPFLPDGEVLAWNMTSVPNELTKKNEYTFTVCVQTAGAFRGCTRQHCDVKCDGPCGNRTPSSQLIQMGKCEHLLCKACYGLVKNPDGSYGCSNFQCWREPEESSHAGKRNYRKVIQKQMERARKLKDGGEDVARCERPPKTSSLSRTASTSSLDSYGLIKNKQ